MARGGTAQAIADSREAWEAGFSIVATKLNFLLKSHSLAISSTPPKDRRTLEQCRHDFIEGLRRALVPIPRYPIEPWSVGFIYGEKKEERLIGSGLKDGGADKELMWVIDNVLREHSWTHSEWNNLIVKPVACHAHKCRKHFDSLLAATSQNLDPKSGEPILKERRKRGAKQKYDPNEWQSRYDEWKREHNRTRISQMKWADRKKLDQSEVVGAFKALRAGKSKLHTAAQSAQKLPRRKTRQ
jgi:hypothetical protein